MCKAYVVELLDGIKNNEVEQLLFLAAVNTENIYGEAAMRLDASFSFNKETRCCVIDKGSEVGVTIAKLFVSYVHKQFGEKCYSVIH